MDSKACPLCQWWANKKRPHETFVYLAWEWDVDRARAMPPAGEGSIEVAKVADLVDYPPVQGIVRPLRVPVDEAHLDHVPLDVPLILGAFRLGEIESTLCIDGHHRIARAVRDGVAALPYRLLSAEQLARCALRRPPARKKRRA